jgi:hypothetical protein
LCSGNADFHAGNENCAGGEDCFRGEDERFTERDTISEAVELNCLVLEHDLLTCREVTVEIFNVFFDIRQ